MSKRAKRPRRTVQPLPSYTRRKPLADGKWAYYFEPPSWARKPKTEDDRGPCPVGAEELGSDYKAAVARAEAVLLPLFESWRTRGLSDFTPGKTAAPGTLDWLFAEYRRQAEYKDLGRKTKALHEQGFRLVGEYVLTDGRRLGAIKLVPIDKTVTKPLYAKLKKMPPDGELPLPEIDAADDEDAEDEDAASAVPERLTTANHAMKSCRRAWNVVADMHPEIPANPFARLRLRSSKRETPTATYPELASAVAEADAMGLFSLGTALMLTWEWLQREEHIFTAFKLDHYRPAKRPDQVLIVHPKNDEKVWIPLFDKSGPQPVPLFPELMARMDRMKRDRIGDGLFFVRDWVDKRRGVPLPWMTPKGNIDMVPHKAKAIIRSAGLDDSLSFTSFRHGGLTELGDSDLTDAQIRAVSRQRSASVLPRYVKRTERQIIAGTHKRRAVRPQGAADAGEQLSFDALLRGRAK